MQEYFEENTSFALRICSLRHSERSEESSASASLDASAKRLSMTSKRETRGELKKFTRLKFPQDERFDLTDQLWRALDSIILNIAEGSGKYSDIEFSKFLNTALTSLAEVVACLDASLDDEYISETEHAYWLTRADDLHRELSAFSSKVRNDAKRH